MDCRYLAEQTSAWWWWPEGEVQVFADYRDRVASAVQARRELVANPAQPVLCETAQVLISRRRDEIKRRRVRCRRQQRGGPV